MLTEFRNLYTGQPIWSDYKQPRLPVGNLDQNVQTDVLVVGAGISGAMIAYELAAKGLDVVIVDRRKPLHGSTLASTALLQYEIDVPLIQLIDKIGRDPAIAAWRRSKLAVESLASKIRELDIDCAYERRNTLYLNGNVLNARELVAECAMRNQIGLHGQMLDQTMLYQEYGVHAKAGILTWDNVAVNPVQLAAGFLKAACHKGAQLYSPVTVETLESKTRGVRVTTSAGKTIRAKHVVFATGYEMLRSLRTRKHRINSTWAIATKPLPQHYLHDLPFMWQAADPYLYLRMTADNRLICGGEDDDIADADRRDTLIPRKCATIERKLRKLLPDLKFTVDHQWAGAFGGSTTGLPTIGAVPGYKNVYAAMAYGGNGITFSVIAAEMLAAQVTKRFDPDAALFAF